jgi:hypothetical protein
MISEFGYVFMLSFVKTCQANYNIVTYCCARGNNTGRCAIVRVRRRLTLCALLLGHLRATWGAEHEAHLPGIYNSFVLIAVVEQDMHLPSLLGDIGDLAGPGLELLFGVKIIETFSRADAFPLPRLTVPAMEADQPDVGRYFGDRRHTRLEALRLVDAHE